MFVVAALSFFSGKRQILQSCQVVKNPALIDNATIPFNAFSSLAAGSKDTHMVVSGSMFLNPTSKTHVILGLEYALLCMEYYHTEALQLVQYVVSSWMLQQVFTTSQGTTGH